MDTLALGQEEWQSNWVTNIEPHPETVTVTLTQTDSLVCSSNIVSSAGQ